MRFVQTADLKIGMKIAKPIYNKKGVLLYSRGTEINEHTLRNIGTMNLFGMYILEPTEPLPPVSDEELEFERFQVVSGYTLDDALRLVLKGEIPHEIETLASDIQHRFGRRMDKVNFIQTLRNPDDHVFKHSVNVAILTALITNKLGIDRNEQYHLIMAALLHDMGKLLAPVELLNKTSSLSYSELTTIRNSELEGYNLIRENYFLSASVRRYFVQMAEELSNKIHGYSNEEQRKVLLGTKILKVADLYDILTAMRVYKEPMSEFSAISFMLSKEDEYDESIVDAIVKSIYILPVGACVELTNGEKGLILAESEYYALRPRILSFNGNVVYDLAQKKVYEKVRIKDILKTMDNRFVFKDTLQH